MQPDTTKLADQLVQHSGGKVYAALQMAIEQGEIIVESIKSEVDDDTDKVADEKSLIVGNPMKEEREEAPEKKGHLFDCSYCC